MFKTPLHNAFGAVTYIALIALGLHVTSGMNIPEPNILIPIAMLSLLTLSVAIMGYFFVLNPLQLYLDGHKKEAVTFFLHTIGIFALITLTLFVIILLRS